MKRTTSIEKSAHRNEETITGRKRTHEFLADTLKEANPDSEIAERKKKKETKSLKKHDGKLSFDCMYNGCNVQQNCLDSSNVRALTA
jgi:hypothetical protein